MQFTDILEKIKIKLLAPSTVCYRQLGQVKSEFKYWSWLPAYFAFKNEPKDDKGFYKTVYINNKRIKPWYIIPRNAFIEIREKPHGIEILFGAIVGLLAKVAITGVVANIIAGVATAVIVGGLAAAMGFGLMAASGAFSKKKSSNSSGTPSYSSNDNPSLSGCKNEILEGCVPIAFGRMQQTFNYAQFSTPLIKSGYAGNRYRVYFVSGYENARYSDFKSGSVLLSDYRATAYSLSQAHGTSNFIGWDNACTENFNNKELSFDNTQSVFQSAIAYYNQIMQNPISSFSLQQEYTFEKPALGAWIDKNMEITATYISSDGTNKAIKTNIIITQNDLVLEEEDTYKAVKNISFALDNDTMVEYTATSTVPIGQTRGSGDATTLITLSQEKFTSDDEEYISEVNQGVNSYSGDRNEIISQSFTETKYCDIHFSFPQGLYRINDQGGRNRETIRAEVLWKNKGDTVWKNLNESNIERIYTRNIDGEIENLSSRIGRNGNVFTFNTPANIDDANSNFYECVGIQFAEEGQYLVKIMPVAFSKDDKYIGTINISDIVWRLKKDIPVVASSMLPHVSQIACTFNATTQLDGEVDEINAICFPYIKNIETMQLEQSRNPVDVIYYLLTDEHSNPNPMQESQFDMDSFIRARRWCEEHNCKCDGIVSEDVKYETIINDICSNNQLYLIPNKWGKVVIRVDTNEDGRPIKTLFTADNSWDLEVTRVRGKLGRTMALRFSYTDEETWSEQEITGYWYNNQCNWQPEEGKDDEYYQTEKRDIKYIVNADNIKRRIAYELELANVKNTKATFKVAREVLDLEVLDRVLVADYTRIKDGQTGNVERVLKDNNGNVIGIKSSVPFPVTQGMSITIRSVDVSGNGANVNTYILKENENSTSELYFETPILAENSHLRNSGFYKIDGQEFYYSGDLFMAGTAELLNMVISEIEEISGDDFTSKITCRTY